MDKGSYQDKRSKTGGKVITLHDDIYWSVVYNRDDNAIYISALDYHTGPLKINRSMAEKFSIALGIHDEDEHVKVQHEPEKKITPSAPLITLNKKEQCAEIAVAGTMVKLTRKELYRLGKKLGKRAKLRSAR